MGHFHEMYEAYVPASFHSSVNSSISVGVAAMIAPEEKGYNNNREFAPGKNISGGRGQGPGGCGGLGWCTREFSCHGATVSRRLSRARGLRGEPEAAGKDSKEARLAESPVVGKKRQRNVELVAREAGEVRRGGGNLQGCPGAKEDSREQGQVGRKGRVLLPAPGPSHRRRGRGTENRRTENRRTENRRTENGGRSGG
jgi:hypothetical protein